MHELIGPSVNFLILVAVLGYYLREPMKNFVSQRHVALKDELSRVRELLSQAQAKNEEFSSKLKAIDAEVATLRHQMQEDAQSARQRVVSEAQRLSGVIVSDARQSAQSLYSELKRDLYTEMGTQIVERAEKLLKDRLTGDDQARIRKEFSNQVESVR